MGQWSLMLCFQISLLHQNLLKPIGMKTMLKLGLPLLAINLMENIPNFGYLQFFLLPFALPLFLFYVYIGCGIKNEEEIMVPRPTEIEGSHRTGAWLDFSRGKVHSYSLKKLFTLFTSCYKPFLVTRLQYQVFLVLFLNSQSLKWLSGRMPGTRCQISPRA